MKTISFDTINRETAEFHAAEAAIDQPVPYRLTPKAVAVAAGRRFVRELRALPPDDRAVILADFASDLRDVIAELAAGA